MENRIQTWLLDIDRSIDEIFVFVNETKDFFQYQNDIKTKKAVERNIEIIGEAIGRILKEDNTFQIENAKYIIGTRNRIVHSYDNISDEIIWTILSRDLAPLKREVAKHLDSQK